MRIARLVFALVLFAWGFYSFYYLATWKDSFESLVRTVVPVIVLIEIIGMGISLLK